jgi:hypothetical protein
LKEFLTTFSAYEEETQLNPEKYVRGLDDFENPASVDEIKSDITKHMEEEKRIDGEIPDSLIISFFQIKCKDIKKIYMGKHSSIVDKEIKMIAQRARDENNRLSLEFEDMEARIRKNPGTIEELVEIKDYMAALPGEIEKEK